jgi:hypothetical protein
MSDLSEDAEILQRARKQQQLEATAQRIVVTSIEPSKKPPVYTLMARSGKVVAMMEDATETNGKIVIAEIRSNLPATQ